MLEMDAKLKCDTVDRLAASPIHTKLICGFDAESVFPNQNTADLGVPIKRIMEIRDSTGAVNIEVSLSLGRRSDIGKFDEHGNLRSLGILQMVQQAFGLNPSKLVASIKSDDGPVEILDLLDHREVDEVPDSDLPLTGGRRWPYVFRAAAIRQRFAVWLQQQP